MTFKILQKIRRIKSSVVPPSLARFSFYKNNPGIALIHASVVIILAGALASRLGSVRGEMELAKGQAKDTILTGNLMHRLRFTVKLEDFSLQWYAHRPRTFAIAAEVADKNFRQRYALAMNQVQQAGSTGYSISVIDYMPHFSLTADKKPRNLSEMPRNPAVLVRIVKGRVQQDRWVLSLQPQAGAGDTAIKVQFFWKPMVKGSRSTVRVNDKNRAVIGTVRVNAPFRYQGYTFYQAGYDEKDLSRTRLTVVRDPGAGIVFAGLVFLNLGVMMVCYPKLGLSVLMHRGMR